jgi:hypothetical protein
MSMEDHPKVLGIISSNSYEMKEFFHLKISNKVYSIIGME